MARRPVWASTAYVWKRSGSLRLRTKDLREARGQVIELVTTNMARNYSAETADAFRSCVAGEGTLAAKKRVGGLAKGNAAHSLG